MKTMYRPISFLCFLFLLGLQLLSAQDPKGFKIHSHNDYLQPAPFWNAYGNGLESIEVDVFLKHGTLYATHSEAEIKEGHTIESLYLQPLQKAFELQLGDQQPIQLLVDIKSEAYSTLKKIVAILKKYPKIIKNPNITIVISGSRPKPADYPSYPEFIKFDYQSLDGGELPAEIWRKVAMISLNYKNTSQWNGKGPLPQLDRERIQSVIDQAHNLGKPFRFWGAPDTELAWRTFVDLGMDYINTDRPAKSSEYLNLYSSQKALVKGTSKRH